MLQFDDMGFLMPIKPIESNLAEFQATFVINEQRERLFSVYLEFLEELKKLGIGNYFQWLMVVLQLKKICQVILIL